MQKILAIDDNRDNLITLSALRSPNSMQDSLPSACQAYLVEIFTQWVTTES